MDPDEAGRKGIYKLGKFLNKNRIFNVNVALMPDGKDVNDLTLEEFKQVQVISFKDWKNWYESEIISSS